MKGYFVGKYSGSPGAILPSIPMLDMNHIILFLRAPDKMKRSGSE